MNKFWMITIGVIAGIVALSNLGALAALALSGVLIYIGVHYYLRSATTGAKVGWASLAVIGGLTAVSNVPALIGAAALWVLWIIYRKWNGLSEEGTAAEPTDPFSNFEKEWQKLSK